MAYIQLRTSSTQSVTYGINGMFIPFGFTMYDISRLFAQALINIYHGVVIGALEVGPDTPNGLTDVYEAIRLNVPNTEIILTQDPYDALGNVVRFLSEVDDSIGRDGDVLISTVDFKMYKRENGIYVFKFQMQGGSGVAVAAQWHFSESINNSLGVDGDLLLRPGGQIYKKVNGTYVYQMLITGNAGANGTNGIDGTQIYVTTGTNYTGEVNENDLNIVDGINLYKYTSGFWVLVGPIRGITGLKGDRGDTGEASEIFVTSVFGASTGKDGDIVINPTTLEVHKKILGAYVYQSTLATPEGALWHYLTEADNDIGKDGDMLLDSHGDVYKRINGAYELQVNIKGPAGDKGADGADGSQIRFMTVIDDDTGADGDIVFVESDVYQRVDGRYELQGTIGGGGSGSGSGFIDWMTVVNNLTINMNSSYQQVASLKRIDKMDGTGIAQTPTQVLLPPGSWDISLDVSSTVCPFYIMVTVGSTVLIEKIVQTRDFSFSRNFILNAEEVVTVSLKTKTTGTIPPNGLSLKVFKIGEGSERSSFTDTVIASPEYRYIYSLDASSTTIPNDGTGTLLEGEKVGSSGYSSELIFGKTRKCLTTSECWTISNLGLEGLDFYGSNSFTVSMYMKITSVTSPGGWLLTFQKHAPCGESGIQLSSDGKLGFISNRVGPCDGNGLYNFVTSLLVPLTEWFALTYSYNGTTREQKVFVNTQEFISYIVPRDISGQGIDQIVVNGYQNIYYGSASTGTISYSDFKIKKGLFISSGSMLSGGIARSVPSLVDTISTSCSGKVIYNINTSTPTTIVPLDSSMSDADIIYINLLVPTNLYFASHSVDNKKVLIYIVQDTTTPKYCTIDTTNMVFNGFILSSDLVVSNTTNDIDMLGIEYNQAESKWEVLSFLNNVF